MKICLVYPNIMTLPKFLNKTMVVSSDMLPPLGMLYLLSNSNYKMDFIDNRLYQYSDKELHNKLKEYDVVGFGGTCMEALQAKNVSKLLRKEGITTIYGGPNATLIWKEYINDFDIILKGEGEKTLNEVLHALEKNKPLDNVQGIVFNNGKIIETQDRQFIQDLDKLNYPLREIPDFKKYLRDAKPFLKVNPVDTVVSSRGCPFDCAFCSSKYFWKRVYRAREPEKVVEEIKYLMDKFGTKGIHFREDNFTVSRERVLKFCKLIKPLNIVWVCESRVDSVDEEMLKEMKSSGCEGIWFGVESCSNKTLKLINKGATIEQAKRAIKLCKKLGIFVGGAFIVGFPHETKEDMLHTLKESKKLGLDVVIHNRLCGFPKSELYIQAEKEGLNKYEYENITLPSTQYVDADKVTNLFLSNVFNWKIRLWKKLPVRIRKFIKKRI